MQTVKLNRQVILESDEMGGYTVSCPSLPGCHSQGKTVEEALANIREAIELYIEVLREDGLPIPEDRIENKPTSKSVCGSSLDEIRVIAVPSFKE